MFTQWLDANLYSTKFSCFTSTWAKDARAIQVRPLDEIEEWFIVLDWMLSETLLCIMSQTRNNSHYTPIAQLDGVVFWQQLFKRSPVILRVFDVVLWLHLLDFTVDFFPYWRLAYRRWHPAAWQPLCSGISGRWDPMLHSMTLPPGFGHWIQAHCAGAHNGNLDDNQESMESDQVLCGQVLSSC